jgi:agmatine deiminase
MTANKMFDPVRRRVLGAAAGLAGSFSGLATPAAAQKAYASAYRIPGEFEPQSAIWLSYDVNLESTTTALVQALSAYTPLKFLVVDDAAAEQARQLLASRQLLKPDISFHTDPLAIYYPRDGAVFATAPGQQLGVVDFQWNQYGMPAWCRQRYRDNGKQQSLCVIGVDRSRQGLDQAMARMTKSTLLPSSLVMEGGGVESNGQGLLIACEAMVRSRNPDLPRAELQRHLLRLPGVKKIIWLPEGLAHDPHLRSSIAGRYVAWGTGGHTDEFVRFADANTVLLAWPDEQEARRHPVARLNQQRMQRNAAVLAAARNVQGQPLRVLRVPMPRMVEQPRVLSADANRDRFDEWTADFFPASERRREGETVIQVATTSYLNFVIGNGVIVLPDYRAHGTPDATHKRVEQIFQGAFPGRDIRWVDPIALNWLGGGLHCATLHEPLPL